MDEPQTPIIINKPQSTTDISAVDGSSVIRILQRPKSIENLAQLEQGSPTNSEKAAVDGIVDSTTVPDASPSSLDTQVSWSERKKKYESARLRIFGTTEPSEVVSGGPPEPIAGTASIKNTEVGMSNGNGLGNSIVASSKPNQYHATVEPVRLIDTSSQQVYRKSYDGTCLHQHQTSAAASVLAQHSYWDRYYNSMLPFEGLRATPQNLRISGPPGSFARSGGGICMGNYMDEQNQLINLISQISKMSMQERQSQRTTTTSSRNQSHNGNGLQHSSSTPQVSLVAGMSYGTDDALVAGCTSLQQHHLHVNGKLLTGEVALSHSQNAPSPPRQPLDHSQQSLLAARHLRGAASVESALAQQNLMSVVSGAPAHQGTSFLQHPNGVGNPVAFQGYRSNSSSAGNGGAIPNDHVSVHQTPMNHYAAAARFNPGTTYYAAATANNFGGRNHWGHVRQWHE